MISSLNRRSKCALLWKPDVFIVSYHQFLTETELKICRVLFSWSATSIFWFNNRKNYSVKLCVSTLIVTSIKSLGNKNVICSINLLNTWCFHNFTKQFLITAFDVLVDLQLWSFIKRQRQRMIHRVTTSGTTSDHELQRVTTNDNEWYNKWQWVVERVTTSDNQWQRVTTNYNEWQRSFWQTFPTSFFYMACDFLPEYLQPCIYSEVTWNR